MPVVFHHQPHCTYFIDSGLKLNGLILKFRVLSNKRMRLSSADCKMIFLTINVSPEVNLAVKIIFNNSKATSNSYESYTFFLISPLSFFSFSFDSKTISAGPQLRCIMYENKYTKSIL